jgi:hypothetical protein
VPVEFPVTEAFKNAANAAQLHAAARGSLPVDEWPAFFAFIGGRWVYRIDRDSVDVAAVQAAIDAHVPNPNWGVPADDLTLRGYRDKANLTNAEVASAIKLLLKKLID